MSKEVLIFLSTFDKKDALMDEKNDFIIGQVSESLEYAELGTVFDYMQIPPNDVEGFIKAKIKELTPLWVIGDGTSASALMKMNVPGRLLVNPSVAFDDLNNVPDHIRETTYGFFDKDHEEDYNRFQSAFPHSALYPEQYISLLDLKSILVRVLANNHHWGDEEHGIFIPSRKAMETCEEIGESCVECDEQTERDHAIKSVTFTVRGKEDELNVIKQLFLQLDTHFHIEDENGKGCIPVGILIQTLIGSPYYEGLVYPLNVELPTKLHFNAELEKPHALLYAFEQALPNLEFEME